MDYIMESETLTTFYVQDTLAREASHTLLRCFWSMMEHMRGGKSLEDCKVPNDVVLREPVHGEVFVHLPTGEWAIMNEDTVVGCRSAVVGRWRPSAMAMTQQGAFARHLARCLARCRYMGVGH